MKFILNEKKAKFFLTEKFILTEAPNNQDKFSLDKLQLYDATSLLKTADAVLNKFNNPDRIKASINKHIEAIKADSDIITKKMAEVDTDSSKDAAKMTLINVFLNSNSEYVKHLTEYLNALSVVSSDQTKVITASWEKFKAKIKEIQTKDRQQATTGAKTEQERAGVDFVWPTVISLFNQWTTELLNSPQRVTNSTKMFSTSSVATELKNKLEQLNITPVLLTFIQGQAEAKKTTTAQQKAYQKGFQNILAKVQDKQAMSTAGDNIFLGYTTKYLDYFNKKFNEVNTAVKKAAQGLFATTTSSTDVTTVDAASDQLNNTLAAVLKFITENEAKFITPKWLQDFFELEQSSKVSQIESEEYWAKLFKAAKEDSDFTDGSDLEAAWETYYTKYWGTNGQYVKALGKPFILEVMKLGYTAQTNPFVQFLKQGLFPKNIHPSANTYAGIHNLVADRTIAYTELRNIGKIGENCYLLLTNPSLYSLSNSNIEELIDLFHNAGQLKWRTDNSILASRYGINAQGIAEKQGQLLTDLFFEPGNPIATQDTHGLASNKLKDPKIIRLQLSKLTGTNYTGDFKRSTAQTALTDDIIKAIVAKFTNIDEAKEAAQYLAANYLQDQPTIQKVLTSYKLNRDYDLLSAPRYKKLFNNYKLTAHEAESLIKALAAKWMPPSN